MQQTKLITKTIELANTNKYLHSPIVSI